MLDLYAILFVYSSMIDIFIYNPFAWLIYSFLLMVVISYFYADEEDF